MFQNPQNCFWLVIRWNQFGPQDSNQVHRHQKLTFRHVNKCKFHTWRMESSFVFVQHQLFQFHKLFWIDFKKNVKRLRRRKSHSKVIANDEPYCKDSLNFGIFDVKKSEKGKQWKSKSLRYESWQKWKNGSIVTCSQHATQGGTLTKLDLFTSRKLLNYGWQNGSIRCFSSKKKKSLSHSKLETMKHNWIQTIFG